MVKELIKNIKDLIRPWVYLKSENYSKTEMDSLLDDKADLVNGLIPENQLPSYVDDVIEGYYHNYKFYEDSSYNNLISPEDSKIYVSLSDNKCYRYSGSVFVEISSSLAIGNTASTALAGNTNYAGSTSQGGSANSAVKLDSSAGAANIPVYFLQGVPAALPYELNANVPANAIFTDTTYSNATTSAAGLMSKEDKTKLDSVANNANNYSLPVASSSVLGGVKVGNNLNISNGVLNASDTITGDETTIVEGTNDTKFATRISVINYVDSVITDSIGGDY